MVPLQRAKRANWFDGILDLCPRTLFTVLCLCVRAYGASTRTPPPIAKHRDPLTVLVKSLTSMPPGTYSLVLSFL